MRIHTTPGGSIAEFGRRPEKELRPGNAGLKDEFPRVVEVDVEGQPAHALDRLLVAQALERVGTRHERRPNRD